MKNIYKTTINSTEVVTMKKFKTTSIGFVMLAATFATGAVFAANENELVKVCEGAIPEAISITAAKRIRFKSIGGVGSFRTLIFKMRDDEQQVVKIFCKVEKRTGDIVSIKKNAR
jgi:hypothetical protein